MKKYTDISDIYSPENEIFIDQDFQQSLRYRRKNKYTPDKALIKSKRVFVDINNIENLQEGRIYFLINNARFECFFKKGTREKLYIVLNGARTFSAGKKRALPVLSRWGYYSFSEYSWLSIEDPMYYEDDNISLGWFYGDSKRNFREYVALIAEKISNYLKIDKNSVVFFGGSGGGTAAIHAAALFGSGVAISINGQLNFENEKYNRKIKHFWDETGIDLRLPDKFSRNDLCKIMTDERNVKFILIENALSNWDLHDHFEYAIRKLNITPSYGINQFDNIITYVYDAPGREPHSSFENRNIYFALDFLASLAATNENIMRYKNLFLLFNEFWYDYYAAPISNQFNSQAQITLLDKNYLKKRTCFIDKITTKIIEPKDEKYNGYKYTNLRANMTYHIELKNITTQSNISSYTAGVIDFDNRIFILRKECPIEENIFFDFITGSSIGNLKFCIFAGEHGKTNGNDLSIGELNICFQFNK